MRTSSFSYVFSGHVVDRNDLYKSSSKKKPDKSPHEKEKQKMDESKKRKDVPDSTKEIPSKQKAAAAKLKINEVMSAVLGTCFYLSVSKKKLSYCDVEISLNP